MNINQIAFIFGFFSFFLFSCKGPKEASVTTETPGTDSLVVFSTTLINEFNLTSIDLKRLQYQIGKKRIVLEKMSSQKKSKKIKDGKLHVSQELNKKKIIFPPNTPLVAKRVGDEGRLGVVGSKKKNRLIFGLNKDGDYTLYVFGKKEKFFVRIRRNWFKKDCYLVSEGIGEKLYINLNQIRKINNEVEIEKGRTLKKKDEK